MSSVDRQAEPELLTVSEAQERLRLSRSAMYGAIARGEIPTIRLGRRFLIPRVRLDRLIAGELDQQLPKR